MTLRDEIINLLMSTTDEYLNGEQILTRLEKNGIKIPKENGLYDVNEFIDLEREGMIVYDSWNKAWRLDERRELE